MAEFLSQDEIDSLMDIGAEADEPRKVESIESVDFATYNFKRPNRMSSETIRSISFLHDKVLRDIAGDLSGVIKKIVDIELVSVDQMTYGEFTLSLSDDTNYNILDMAPSDGKMALEFNSKISRLVLNYLIGATKELDEGEEDVITDLEVNILNHFLSIVRNRLHEAWDPIAKMDFDVITQERNPANTILVPAGDIIILVVIQVDIEGSTEMFNLCYPKAFLEPIFASHDINKSIMDTKINKSRNEDIQSLISGSRVKLDAILTKSKLSTEDIVALKEGDIIVFDEPISTLKGSLIINGKEKYIIDYLDAHGKKCVKLIDKKQLEHQETIDFLSDLEKRRANAKKEAKDQILAAMEGKE